MINQISQELLDEMIHMDQEQFKIFEEKWLDNLSAKAQYEKQYFSQIGEYALHNQTFGKNQLPLTPSEKSNSLDMDIVKEAKAINFENARLAAIQKAIQEQRQSISHSFANEREQITSTKTPGQEINQQLEKPVPPHVSKEVNAIAEKLMNALKHETLEHEWETELSYPANDLNPNYEQFEMEL